MGAMNLFGIGTDKNINQAISCLRQAAERGNIYVSYHLLLFFNLKLNNYRLWVF